MNLVISSAPQTDQYHQYDKSSSTSRRSIDWRDSGIVIDDEHSCNSSESVYFGSNFNSVTSIEQSTSAATSGSLTSEKILAHTHDDDGDTLLHLAVVGFTVDNVKDLIPSYDLNAINNMLHTPLHVSTMANRPEMVQLLTESGAKLNVQDRRGNTPLHMACQKGHREIVTILLDYVNSINRDHQNSSAARQYIETANFDGQTCLHLAALNNNKEIVRTLVDHYGANVNCPDSKSGSTILHNAIHKFNYELVDLILGLSQHCNQPDFSGLRPLDTIDILRQSKLSEGQLEVLSRAEERVCERINACKLNDGCCLGLIEDRIREKDIVDSSPSSECSDSEAECSSDDQDSLEGIRLERQLKESTHIVL